MNLIRRSAARDLRVDFFRGLALWWIYTDHIPGNVLGDISLRNFATCDATEVFVLLAGYGGGLSYGMNLSRNGILIETSAALRVGDELELEFRLEAHRVAARGRVVRHGGPRSFGVQFDPLAEGAAERIERFVGAAEA